MPKKDDQGGAKKKLPTYKGNAGLPTIPAKSSALALPQPMPKAALDARQANINIRRKPGGPPRPDGGAPMANAIERAPDVPPTDCAEPPKGKKP